ncbi:VOC family protein [Streptomyces albireticuli]|uniref:Hydroxylase n=1 Tax=Streptomyces albireticuli TaxID=1940 RepID=A0A2A2DE53_9ACTN|nr:VOC family protein [Streptomyces albireticuli]MCD9140907.1 VOC family protein [Streptomyces albireticuli]MCD9161131.1 VOC family protein [Streptomyces albireticuli]MCD9190811.1 VOC family protein [Streptomyces albireticuli]PAU49726.1 hydroxylase [Streptomyces albireticuli]
MITTDFVPGSPCWLDLGSRDIPATAAFYGAVFGWEYKSFGEEGGGYGLFRLDGKTVAGLGPLNEEGARPAWTLYFRTTDAQAAAKAVERAGGAVRVAPTDAGEYGSMAQLTDPQGGQFAVWQPGETGGGVELADAPGSLCWTELYTTDAAGAKAFYGGLFGWTASDVPLPGDGGTYSILTPAGQGEERMHGGLMELPSEHLSLNGGRPYWHPVFATADCDATAAKVTANGGTLQMGPEDAEGVGRLAVCVDPAGADFVVLTPAEEAKG